jgi:DNA-directed RNA polymerase delta subunit
MNSKVPLIELAYQELDRRKRPISFSKLWENVCKKSELPEAKLKRMKGNFYAELIEDHRFASCEDNRWCLRKKKKYTETTIYDDDGEYIEYDEKTDNELRQKDSEDVIDELEEEEIEEY